MKYLNSQKSIICIYMQEKIYTPKNCTPKYIYQYMYHIFTNIYTKKKIKIYLRRRKATLQNFTSHPGGVE